MIMFCCFVLYLQSDENEDDKVDSQNGDHESSAPKNKSNVQCKGKTRNHLFNLTLVNSYGSADIEALEDNDKPLKITGKQISLVFQDALTLLTLIQVLSKSCVGVQTPVKLIKC